jgi:hypothetical protein
LSNSVPPFPASEFPSVKDLCFAAIRKFTSTGLKPDRQRLGPGAQPRPLEAQYQDEFYRACYDLLGTVYLSSEWTGKETTGRVDFRVKEMGWVIECGREGQKLKEHIARFAEGGRYAKWIQSGEVRDHILLDFRTSMPCETRGMMKYLLIS